MPISRQPVEVFIKRLNMLADLPEEVSRALAGTVAAIRNYGPDQEIVCQGDKPTQCLVVLEGWVGRNKVVDAEGKRQITAIHFAGAIPDLQSIFVPSMDHNISALTAVTAGFIPHVILLDLLNRYSALNKALWKEVLVDAAISREWEVNLAARPAAQRIAHVFCETGTRLQWFGQAHRTGAMVSFDWPMSQTLLGEMTGLSSVHVNRSLQTLRSTGMIEANRQTVSILDMPRLAEFAGFNPDYLLAEAPRKP